MTRMSPYPICFALALSASLCFAQSAGVGTAVVKPAVDLKSLREAYSKAMSKIESEHANAVQGQPTSYLKQLTKLQLEMQKAGDLDGWTTVNHEIERFKAEQTIPDEADASMPDGIKALRTAYKSAMAKFDLEQSKKIVAATKQYVEQLNVLQTSLTKAGKVDQAIEVNTEIKTVKSDSKVTSSEFAVAAAEQQTESKQSPEQPTQTPDQTKKDAGTDKSAKPSGKVIESGGAKIYDGQPFQETPGQSFKNVTVMATDRVTGSQKISMTATLNVQSDVKKTRTNYGWDETKQVKQGSISHVLRLTIKPAIKTFTVDDPKLVIQFFSRGVAEGGKVNPKLTNTQTISLPKLDSTRALNVECAPVALESSSVKLTSAYWGEYASNASGNEFYGFVASVFDSKGALVFQTTSNNGLKKLGLEKLP